jgi:histidine triad (HIT) family protein
MPEYDDNNVFAKILRGEMPCTKVYEDDNVFAFMDIMPRADGHTLVIPKAKARNMLDISPGDLADLIKAVQKIAHAVHKAMGSQGFIVQQFNEEAGGQVVLHLHFHIIPRWEGVRLRPAMGDMAPPEVLAEHAEKIRAELQS